MDRLLSKHGGYRNLKSFQVSQLIYDITVLFVEKYVDRFSRTQDQMVQAARSGVQNIAEGSVASATSKKTELKLTQVARASLEELKLDYEDFLRQRELEVLDYNGDIMKRFKQLKPETLENFREWVADEHETSKQRQKRTNTDNHQAVSVNESLCKSSVLSSACLAANGSLSLLNVACYLLDKQVSKLADDFEDEGGFTERLYRVRKERKESKRSF